jgi:type VI secretion system secreted protein Hcp
MAFDTYLYFPGSGLVKGETMDSDMAKKEALELASFSFGAENTVNIGSASGGAGAGKVSFHEFEVTKKTDTASCGLFQTCCTGNHFDEAIIEMRRAGGSTAKSGATFMKFHFKMVVVNDISWSGSDGDDTIEETVKFRYGAIKVEYFKQDSKGKMTKASGSQGEVKWSQVLNEANYSVSR